MADISKVKLPGNDTIYYVKDARIAYGTCSTTAATAEKAVSATGFTLVTGARIAVKFTVTNTAVNPTLNVNSTGAKAIYYRGVAISAGYLAANRTYEFIYNGTQYELIGDLDTNSTYSSKTAASGGTDVSLVTTGEKYTWNNKSTLAIGTTSTTAAAGNHKHPISIATDSGTNQLTLAASTKYKLTAGDSSYIFTTPPNTGDTHYTTHVYAGSGTAANAATTNGNTKLTIADNTTVPSTNGYVTIKGTGATTVTSDANGVITINSTDTNTNTNTVPSAYCDTAAATKDKVASCTNYALQGNTYTHVLITVANTAQDALTLNINNRGAKPIYINGAASSSSNYTLPAGTYLVYFDGTNYYFRTDGVLAKTSYTPAGSVTVTPSVTAPTTTVNSITAVGTLPSCTMPTYSVDDEILTITAGSFSAGTLPTKGADTTVVKSVSVTATGSFSGTAATISVKGN